MADNREARAAVAISVPAAIAAALAYINSRKAQAAPPGGELTLPEAFVDLIIALAESTDAMKATVSSMESDLKEIARQLAALSINVQGFPPNARGIRSFTRVCEVANQAYQGDDMEVPEGMSLLIKSYPTNPVGSIVRVASAFSDATNINSSWPLMPNEAIAYQVQNANQIYVSGSIAGLLVVFSVEKAEFVVR
ncbi:MAG: hypothetical protein ACUVTR_01935 [Dehalococcoidia bacterium]